VNGKGDFLWDRKGVPVCMASGTQQNCAVVGDGDGGALIAWEDYRDGSWSQIYVQSISSGGILRWESDGLVATRKNTGIVHDDDCIYFGDNK